MWRFSTHRAFPSPSKVELEDAVFEIILRSEI